MNDDLAWFTVGRCSGGAGDVENKVKVNPHLYYNHNYMISNIVLCEIQ